MKIQTISLPITQNKTNINNSRIAKSKDGKNDNKIKSINVSPQNQIKKIIENLQDIIKNIRNNEHIDGELKQEKINEIERQIEEMENLGKRMDLIDLKKKMHEDAKKALKELTRDHIQSVGEHGDTSEISKDAFYMIKADKSLKSMKNAHELKTKFESEARVIESEINLDKGKGSNTFIKYSELSEIEDKVLNAEKSLGYALKELNDLANEKGKKSSKKHKNKDDDEININVVNENKAGKSSMNVNLETGGIEVSPI